MYSAGNQRRGRKVTLWRWSVLVCLVACGPAPSDEPAAIRIGLAEFRRAYEAEGGPVRGGRVVLQRMVEP
jgi:hypothetical protein